MKRFICVLLFISLLCGCGTVADGKSSQNAEERIIGVWISYYELNAMLSSGNFKDEFTAAVVKLIDMGAGDAFVHVRAFGESLFESKIYSMSEAARQYDFDIIDFMIKTLKEHNIRFHAWINPFRKQDGTFENPADTAVHAAVIGGIKEILERYPVNGIHFDDYFYPQNSEGIDSDTYNAYIENCKNPLSLQEYRRTAVSSFIFAVRDAIKSKNQNIVFSISPAADIEKNKNLAFADVEYWCSTGAIDYIMPQLYFGYEYPDGNYRFKNLLKRWESLDYAPDVRLIIGLAAYKTGIETPPDNAEWQNENVLPSETRDCFLSKKVSGICFFSYSYLFAPDELHTKALISIKEILRQ